MSDFQAIADRFEIEALRGEFTDALMLLWAALREQSIVAPDARALASLAIWAVVTVLAFGWIGFGPGGTTPDGFDRMAT